MITLLFFFGLSLSCCNSLLVNPILLLMYIIKKIRCFIYFYDVRIMNKMLKILWIRSLKNVITYNDWCSDLYILSKLSYYMPSKNKKPFHNVNRNKKYLAYIFTFLFRYFTRIFIVFYDFNYHISSLDSIFCCSLENLAYVLINICTINI